MSEQNQARILEEIRDLLREQGARQQQAIALQQQALANQEQAVAQHVKAVQTQRRVLRLIVPAIGAIILVVFVLLLRLLGTWSCR